MGEVERSGYSGQRGPVEQGNDQWGVADDDKEGEVGFQAEVAGHSDYLNKFGCGWFGFTFFRFRATGRMGAGRAHLDAPVSNASDLGTR